MKKLSKALALAIQAVEAVTKEGNNTHHRYKFATIGDVLETCRHALAGNGIVLIPSVDSIDRVEVKTSSGTAIKSTVHVTYTLACDDESVAMQWQGEAIDNADKGIAKALTYALKTFLMHLLLLPTRDADEVEHGKFDDVVEQPRKQWSKRQEQPKKQWTKPAPAKSEPKGEPTVTLDLVDPMGEPTPKQTPKQTPAKMPASPKALEMLAAMRAAKTIDELHTAGAALMEMGNGISDDEAQRLERQYMAIQAKLTQGDVR